MKFSVSAVAILASSAIAAPAMAPNKNVGAKPDFNDKEMAILHMLADNKEKLHLNKEEMKQFNAFMDSISKKDAEKRQVDGVEGIVNSALDAASDIVKGTFGNEGGILDGTPELGVLPGDITKAIPKRGLMVPGGVLGPADDIVGGITKGTTVTGTIEGTEIGVDGAVKGVTDTVGGLGEKIPKRQLGGAGDLVDGATGIVEGVTKGTPLHGLGGSVGGLTDEASGAINTVVGKVGRGLSGGSGGPIDGVTGTVGGAVSGVTKGTPVDGINGKVGGVVDGITKDTPVGDVTGVVGSVMSGAGKAVPKRQLQGTGNAINSITGGISTALNGAADLLDGVHVGSARSLGARQTDEVAAAVDAITDSYGGPAGKIAEGVENVVSGAISGLGEILPKRQLDAVTDLVGSLTGSSTNPLDAVTGLVDGLTGGAAGGLIGGNL